MQDYNSLGVTSMEDRRRLFQLIQTIKAEYPDISGTTSVSTPSVSIAPLTHPPTTSISHSASSGIIGLDGSGYGMAGAARNYSSTQPTQNPTDTSIRSSDPRLSLGRRSGSNSGGSVNPPSLGHSRSMSNTMGTVNQQPQQQQQYQQQMQQYQQQQLQLQQLQQQQYLQQQQQQIQQIQQQQQLFDGRNFKEASEEEDDPIPIHESRQRGLDAYSVPTGMIRRNTGGRAPGNFNPNDMTAKIRVCVRKRPLNSKEINRGEKDMATVTGRQLAVDEPKMRVDMTKYIERHNFIFDEVFDTDATNEDVYKRTAYPLIQYLFEGGKATCFAYGQTGSGKTYTMLDDKQGLYVLAARDIFVMLRKPENSHLAAYIGFYEIYQGQLYDLLNSRKRLNPREDGKSNVVISGLKEYEIVNVQGLMQVFEYGNSARSTGSTNANADSSRSHAIMQIVLKNRSNKSVEGKLSFIDLAGSERGADRGDTDVKTRMEGAEINKSLLALKECIRALDQDKKHTPFRQSKLTQVLKDSFVGNSRTCMVATISPNNSNSEHTLNTLRYADRVKELKADGSARGVQPEQDLNGAQDEYMDDVEGNDDDGLGNNVFDDYLSSDGENVADVTIDLLADEEFPNVLDQEEMVQHDLAMNTFDHELDDMRQSPRRKRNDTGRRGDSQQQQSTPQQRQLQQQSLDNERPREPSTKSSREREKDSLLSQPALKGRKSEAFSRLPMPRSSQSTGSSSASTVTSSIPTPQHRHTHSSVSGRNNSSGTSPPLGTAGSSKTGRDKTDSRSSPPDVSMSPSVSNGGANDYVSQKGSGSSISPMAQKYPSVNTTRHGHSSSTSGPLPSNDGSLTSSYAMGSPTSPQVANPAGASIVTPTNSNAPGNNSNGNSPKTNWSTAEMEDFVREHRAQLRDCGELTKRETKLLANVTLGMSSAVHAQSTGYSNDRESFLKY
ncbi:Kinesin-like protein kif24 [Lunasporangiospora selenospora]|uniref:Kinesin-like protein n=1 Tax=Lunasporangiospora selenospora TaxID=979761 RepID=A0A9P6FZT2_9FUNG|nr:Kinesin-like protein kif24 [Lunasporangiospora selenospora]